MNIPPAQAGWLAAAVVLLGLAAASDWTRRRIPNAVTLTLALGGLARGLMLGGWSEAGDAALGLAVGLGVLFVPFALGYLGAGDVKLAAAAGAWLGPGDTAWLLLWSAVAGGVLAAVAYVASPREVRSDVRANVVRLAIPGLRPEAPARAKSVAVPYGVAIAATAVVLILMRSG